MSESSSSSDSSSSSSGSYSSDSGASYGSGSYDSSGSVGGYNQTGSVGGYDQTGSVGGYATGDASGGWPQPYPPGPYDDTHQQQYYLNQGPTTPYGGHYQQPMPYYGQQPPPYPYPGYGYGPIDEGPKNQAIASLVVNISLTLFCCAPLAIAGIVVSALAMSRAQENPASARTLVKWGWGLAIASVVVMVAFIAVVIIAEVASTP